jgi:penicillin-binding protein 2
VVFPRPFTFTDAQLVEFIQQEALALSQVLGRSVPAATETALRHYKARDRAFIPWIILQNLSEEDQKKIRATHRDTWELLPFYVRNYPAGPIASHLLGYLGRTGSFPSGPVENNDPLWPDFDGRDGLEKAFDSVLRGEAGQLNVTYDGTGKKTSEQVAIPPIAGKHVITTLDSELQRVCEKVLSAKSKRGAVVIIDPNSGDILAMASTPSFDPAKFLTNSPEALALLNDSVNSPMTPRGFRGIYPPGSTFKCFVGIAAIDSGTISPNDEFDCPPLLQIGNETKGNWNKKENGFLNLSKALEQSCDTWFYQVSLKLKSKPITDYAFQFGFGEKSTLPLADEKSGFIPTEESMRRLNPPESLTGGNLANLSIGQGAIQVTPLQMALAMGALANGGLLYQPRIVQQTQDVTGSVVHAYEVDVRRKIEISAEALSAVREGMVLAVSGGRGTAHAANLKNVTVAGKTGTAQWGPKHKERSAAWFAGFAPAEGPRLAFAAVYEGEINDHSVHGGSHAAPIIGEILRDYFKDPSKAKPVKPKDASGNEIELLQAPTAKVVPVEPDKDPAGSEPKKEDAPKPSLWKRIFGFGGAPKKDSGEKPRD